MSALANVAATIAGTVYGQLVVKWRVDEADELPSGFGGRVEWALELLVDPWVLTAVAAALLASLTWMAAIARLELSRAYPYLSASFVLVLVLSAAFFDESITAAKGIGVGLIVAGLAAVSRG